jgi:light-regulated signal transduction histidine kinase (bacteriophytochrome)
MNAAAKQLQQDSFVPLHADSLHDLASPVGQIATMFELFLTRQRKRASSDDDEVMNLIQDSTARLQKLVAALQNYDRVAGAFFEPRSCDGNALLSVAIASLHPLIHDSGAHLMYADLPRIHCDFNQLSYVFTGLLDNAIKFRGEDRPEVRISAAPQNGDWLFSVRDNGIGIDPRHRESVFHMFKRINGDRYPGAGAGLAIAHRIIQRHGGRIWVESEPGQGSTFFLTLPC